MAIVTQEIKKHKELVQEVVITEKEVIDGRTITLILNGPEAMILSILTGRICGLSDLRKYTDDIFGKLQNLGFNGDPYRQYTNDAPFLFKDINITKFEQEYK